MTVAFERLRALALAMLDRIEDDDIEGYMAGMDVFEAALSDGLDGPPRPGRAELEELVQIDLAIRDGLNRLKDDVARQLAEMNSNRRASAAYLATSPTGMGDARSA